jgi:hypothetical protein
MSPDRSEWMKSMKDEYNSLQERETWELVPIETSLLNIMFFRENGYSGSSPMEGKSLAG